MTLSNKIVVVMGGGAPGSEFVRACAEEGARVVSADVKESSFLPEGVAYQVRCHERRRG